VMQELREHAEEVLACHYDSTTDQESLLTRHMGHWEEVATCVKDTFQQRYFAGRHPIVTFWLLPIPLGLLAVLLCFLGTFSLAGIVKEQWGVTAQMFYIVWMGGMACNLIPIGVTILYVWLALRSAAGRIAVLCSAGLLALLYSVVGFWIQLSNKTGYTAMSSIIISMRPDLVKLVGMMLIVCLFLYLVKLQRQRTAIIQ